MMPFHEFSGTRTNVRSPLPPINTNNHCVSTRNYCLSQISSKTVLENNVQGPMFIRCPGPHPSHEYKQPQRGHTESLFESIHLKNLLENNLTAYQWGDMGEALFVKRALHTIFKKKKGGRRGRLKRSLPVIPDRRSRGIRINEACFLAFKY